MSEMHPKTAYNETLMLKIPEFRMWVGKNATKESWWYKYHAMSDYPHSLDQLYEKWSGKKWVDKELPK